MKNLAVTQSNVVKAVALSRPLLSRPLLSRPLLSRPLLSRPFANFISVPSSNEQDVFIIVKVKENKVYLIEI